MTITVAAPFIIQVVIAIPRCLQIRCVADACGRCPVVRRGRPSRDAGTSHGTPKADGPASGADRCPRGMTIDRPVQTPIQRETTGTSDWLSFPRHGESGCARLFRPGVDSLRPAFCERPEQVTYPPKGSTVHLLTYREKPGPVTAVRDCRSAKRRPDTCLSRSLFVICRSSAFRHPAAILPSLHSPRSMRMGPWANRIAQLVCFIDIRWIPRNDLRLA